ncbi:MAG: hypothetical protein COZ69_02855 [Deltaproteobacteria bacterium CG_4_8_14_3_um_filter_45_9]|nr:MAG: hypothetical protein COZ69_02855 [Deltaproteobacteria bacterium CG_4_8_14_3_um_filter_45_9]
MIEAIWIRVINEGIPFLFLIGLGFVLYRGLRRNQTLISEREELLKRYLLFRGDRQVRLKIYGGDEKVYMDLLKNISSSWKNFKKAYDRCLLSLAQNTTKTKRFLQLITLGLLINTVRLFIEDYYFFGLEAHFFYTAARELSSYVLVILSFFLLRNQTQKFLTLKGEVVKTDREILFFPNNMGTQEEHEGLYNEFDPLETRGVEDGKEDQNLSE